MTSPNPALVHSPHLGLKPSSPVPGLSSVLGVCGTELSPMETCCLSITEHARQRSLLEAGGLRETAKNKEPDLFLSGNLVSFFNKKTKCIRITRKKQDNK